MHHKVNIVDTEARMVFVGGHPTKYYPPSIVRVCVCVCDLVFIKGAILLTR